MKKLTISLLVLVFGVGAVAYAMNDLKDPQPITYSWNYKLTVDIDTPEGVKTGSAVREVRVIFTPSSGTKSGYHPSKTIKGEAVVIDLGERGKVFAVQSVDDYALPFKAFESTSGGLTLEGAKFYSTLSGKAELPNKNYPMMVAFKNINDPLSVQLLYGTKAEKKGVQPPYVFQNNFGEYFGTGVKLKNISIEMTDEQPLYTVGKILPWLSKYLNKTLDGRRIHTVETENRLANRLGAGSFSTYVGEK